MAKPDFVLLNLRFALIACRLELQNLQLTHRAQRAESELTDLQAFLSQLLAAAAPGAASSSLPHSESSLPGQQSHGMTDLLAETSSRVTSAVTPTLTGHSGLSSDCSPTLPITSPALPIGSLPLPIGPSSMPSGSSSLRFASPIPPIGPPSLPVSSLSVPVGRAYVTPAATEVLLPVGAIRTAPVWLPASSSYPSPVISCRQLPTDAPTCTHNGTEPSVHAAMSTYGASDSQADVGMGIGTMTDSHRSACVALLPAIQRQSTMIGLSAPVSQDTPPAEREQQSSGLLFNSTSGVSPDMPSCDDEQQPASSAQECSGGQISKKQQIGRPQLQTEQPEPPAQHHEALRPQIGTPNQQRLAEGMAAAVQQTSEEMWASLPVQPATAAQALDSSRGQPALSRSLSGLATVAATITSRQKCSLAAGVSSYNTFSPKASGQLGTVLPLHTSAHEAGPVSNSKQLASADSTKRAQNSACPVPKDSPTSLCTSSDGLGPAGSPGAAAQSPKIALSSGPAGSPGEATTATTPGEATTATTPGDAIAPGSASSPGPASSSPAPASPHNVLDNPAISSHGQIPIKSKPRQDTIASLQQPGSAGLLCSSGSHLAASVQMCDPAGWPSSNSRLLLAGRLNTTHEAEQRTMLHAGQTPPDSKSGGDAGITVQSVHVPQDTDPALTGASDTHSLAAQERGTDARTNRTDNPVNPCMDIAKQRLPTDRQTLFSRDAGRQHLNTDSSPNQENLPESNVIDSQVNHSAVDLFCMVSDKGSQDTASPCYALHKNSPIVTTDHCVQPNVLAQHETADASHLILAAAPSATSSVHLRSGEAGIALTDALDGQLQTSAQLESAGTDLALMDTVCIPPTATAYPDSADTDEGLQEALSASHTAWHQPSDLLLRLTDGLSSPSPAIVQRQSADTDLAAFSAGGIAQMESTLMQDEGNLPAAMSLVEGESAERTASLRRLSAGTERRVHVSERLRQMFRASPIMSGHNSEVST